MRKINFVSDLLVSRFLLVLPIIVIMTPAMTGQCFKQNTAFKEGEVLKYEVYYNLGLIWLNAGYVDFKVKPGTYRGRNIYYLDAYGSSYKSYDWIFKVRDRYQCYLDREFLKPLWFHRENYEGGFEVDYTYIFDWENKRVFSTTWNSDRPFSQDTISITPCTFDVLSLIYYCRNLDFNRMKTGDSVPVKAFIDNESHNLYIRYFGKEQLETKEGKKYKCIKFSALLVEGTIFRGGENLFVWVSDDMNRVPVLVDAKILVGSVKAYLVGTEGLLYEQKALVESEINP